LQVAGYAEDGDGDLFAAGAGDHGEEIAVGIGGGVGDDVEVFDHGDGDVGVEGIAGEAVAAEGEIGGDGAGGNADEGAGGTGEVEVGGDFAEEGLGECGVGGGILGGEEVGAEDLEAAAGDGGFGVEAIEVRGVGARWVEQGHVWLGYARGGGDANGPTWIEGVGTSGGLGGRGRALPDGHL
jgi:hypothetical protein